MAPVVGRGAMPSILHRSWRINRAFWANAAVKASKASVVNTILFIALSGVLLLFLRFFFWLAVEERVFACCANCDGENLVAVWQPVERLAAPAG